MNIKLAQRYLRTIASVLVIGMLLSTVASALPTLTLSEAPLFLGISVLPNVFIVLDDSGSMDTDIITNAHWERAAYDRNAWDCRNSSDNNDPNVDCGVFHTEGLIRLSGKGMVNGQNITIDMTKFGYLETCGNSGTGVCSDDNVFITTCTESGTYPSLKNCPSEVKDADWRVRSASVNVMYYNPSNIYKPWLSSSLNLSELGISGFTDADFNNARLNPNPAADNAGYTKRRNLTGFVYYLWKDDKGFQGDGCTVVSPPGSQICVASCTPVSGGRPHRGNKINYKVGCNNMVDLWDSRLKVTVGDTIKVEEVKCNPNMGDGNLNCSLTLIHSGLALPQSVAGYNLGSAAGRSIADEKKNIANWFQYHRRRILTTKAAVDALITNEPKYRYGLMVINNDDAFFEPVVPYVNKEITELALQNHNKNLLTKLIKFDSGSGITPLREALDKAGKYYKGSYSSTKGNPIEHECQQNYALVMTDGFWNESFSPSPPYDKKDGHLDIKGVTIADVAWYYYATDLSTKNDNVRPTSIDPATYQHMVTMGVTFGAEGKLADDNGDGWPDKIVTNSNNPWEPDLKANADWGNPFLGDPVVGYPSQTTCNFGIPKECAEKADDLWHAAYNSRGFFASAKSPEGLAKSLRDALRIVEERQSTIAAAAVNAFVFSTDSHIFQARFNSRDWSGQLRAFSIDAQGGLDNSNPVWDSGKIINDQNWDSGRVIMTYDPRPDQRRGIPFKIGNLTSEQIVALGINPKTGQSDGKSQARLEFLRGRGVPTDGWLEQNNFRERSSKLGDIVNSDPVYVAAPLFRYDVDGYPLFREARKNRTPVIYAGANDGMLHGFNADVKDTLNRGKEVIAYVPSKLFGRLNRLTDPDYVYKNQHMYFVDAPSAVNDVYFVNAWHTVLIGGLGAGGQSIYALDITNPADFLESKSGSLVLWEFNDDGNPKDDSDPSNDNGPIFGDKDLGYTFGKPAVARTYGVPGGWVAVFGNGYNNTKSDGRVSTTGNAVLYIVNISDGKLIKKIDTGVGSDDDPTGAQRPNGLAAPAVVDVDNDFDVDYIYAGDLFGNLWKFDARNPSPALWDVAYKDVSNNPLPLFKAVSSDSPSKPQPITSRPLVDLHPTRQGYMVYFGTGKYIEVDDSGIEGPTQSFYGIWDRDEKIGETLQLTSFTRTNLLEQRIEGEQNQSMQIQVNGQPKTVQEQVRFTSNADINWSTHRGWYMDFKLGSSNRGEKVISDPVLRNRRVIFSTLVPSQDACGFGGTSWLMALDAASGSHLRENPFDLNKDSDFTNDMVVVVSGPNAGQQQAISGRGSINGIIDRVALVTSGNIIIPVNCGTSGDCEDKPPPFNPGSEDSGRQSWRQLQLYK